MNEPLTKEKIYHGGRIYSVDPMCHARCVLSAKNWLKNRLSEEQYLNTNISKLIDEAFDIE